VWSNFVNRQKRYGSLLIVFLFHVICFPIINVICFQVMRKMSPGPPHNGGGGRRHSNRGRLVRQLATSEDLGQTENRKKISLTIKKLLLGF
jgi:hypothetical protein